MSSRDAFEKHFALARLRAERKVRFYKHLFLYLAANFFLALADLVFWPGLLWFFWPLAGWGLALGAYGSFVAVKDRPGRKPKRLLEQSRVQEGEGK